MILNIKSPSTFITEVSTISKLSNSIVSTKLKVVFKDGFFYLTRRNKNSKWYNNLLSNRYAEIRINNKNIVTSAEEMVDEDEKKEVSSIKYADKRREDNRYGFKLTIEDGSRK
tara:strand:- start:447 stop:785 length:339 start_codon:yes stop_codon:yes gene_type:complete